MAVRFAHSVALTVFAVSLLRGILGGDTFAATVQTAILAAVAFEFLGLFCGDLARRIVEENVDAELELELQQIQNETNTTSEPADNQIDQTSLAA